MNLRILAVIGTMSFCIFASQASAQIPSSMPETAAAHRDLSGLIGECDAAIRLTKQLRATTKSVRSDVEDSIRVTQSIKSMDKRLVNLIDRLKPYASIPKVRTITRVLSRNLQRVQTQLHSVRLKTDRCEQKVLRPTHKRIRDLEKSLLGAERKLQTLRLSIADTMSQMEQAAQLAQRSTVTRQTLESASRSLRHASGTTLRVVRQVRGEVEAMGRKLRSLTQYASKFRTVGNSLSNMDRQMKSPEQMVAKLDGAISKRLTIKIPFSRKSVSFTVRQILEKPGQIAGVVLKPLEKLAAKVLDPILGKMKLEMKAPAGLHELSQQLTSLESFQRSLNGAVDQMINNLGPRIDQEIRRIQSIEIRKGSTTRPVDHKPNVKLPTFVTFG